MSITEKLAQALRLMDEAYCDVGPRMDRRRGRQALMQSREALAEYDASQSTPAGEVTADAVTEALEASVDDGANVGAWLPSNLAKQIMQAALAAAYPVLVQQVEDMKESVHHWRRQYNIECENLTKAEAERETLSAENARHEAKITGMVAWLEQNQNDVFSRGIWDAINAATAQAKPPTLTTQGYDDTGAHFD